MAYTSLFDELSCWFDGKEINYRNIAYSGSFRSIFIELAKTLGRQGYPDSMDKIKMIMHPARLICCAVNDKVDRGQDSEESIRLIEDCVDLAVKVYSSRDQSKDSLDDFIKKHNPESFVWNLRINQKKDSRSWKSYHPHLTLKSVDSMKQISEGKDLFVIGLANSGIPVALDALLRYSSDCRVSNSLMYPIRFSTTKKCDRKPQVSECERLHLLKLSEDRKVIIYDEDIEEGYTKSKAQQYFSDMFGFNVPFIANLNPENI